MVSICALVPQITPAHDPNDYECGRRNGLAFVTVLELDGSMNAQVCKMQVDVFSSSELYLHVALCMELRPLDFEGRAAVQRVDIGKTGSSRPYTCNSDK